MDGQPLKPRERTSKWTRHRAVCCVPRTAIGRRYVTELWDLERTLFKTVPNTYPTCPMIRTFYLRHDTVWPTISCLISEHFYRTTGAHLSYALLSSPSIFFSFLRDCSNSANVCLRSNSPEGNTDGQLNGPGESFNTRIFVPNVLYMAGILSALVGNNPTVVDSAGSSC